MPVLRDISGEYGVRGERTSKKSSCLAACENQVPLR